MELSWAKEYPMRSIPSRMSALTWGMFIVTKSVAHEPFTITLHVVG